MGHPSASDRSLALRSVMGENIYPISIPSVVGAAHRSPAPSRLLPFSLSLSPSPSIGPTYERVCCIPRILRIREGGGVRARGIHGRPLPTKIESASFIFIASLSLRLPQLRKMSATGRSILQLGEPRDIARGIHGRRPFRWLPSQSRSCLRSSPHATTDLT